MFVSGSSVNKVSQVRRVCSFSILTFSLNHFRLTERLQRTILKIIFVIKLDSSNVNAAVQTRSTPTYLFIVFFNFLNMFFVVASNTGISHFYPLHPSSQPHCIS